MSEHPEGLMDLVNGVFAIMDSISWSHDDITRTWRRERIASLLAPLWSERDELRRMNATIEQELRPLAASLLLENDDLRTEIARLREEADDESK